MRTNENGVSYRRGGVLGKPSLSAVAEGWIQGVCPTQSLHGAEFHALNNEVHPSKLDQSEVCPICHK